MHDTNAHNFFLAATRKPYLRSREPTGLPPNYVQVVLGYERDHASDEDLEDELDENDEDSEGEKRPGACVICAQVSA